jgi:hypothetical protein
LEKLENKLALEEIYHTCQIPSITREKSSPRRGWSMRASFRRSSFLRLPAGRTLSIRLKRSSEQIDPCLKRRKRFLQLSTFTLISHFTINHSSHLIHPKEATIRRWKSSHHIKKIL